MLLFLCDLIIDCINDSVQFLWMFYFSCKNSVFSSPEHMFMSWVILSHTCSVLHMKCLIHHKHLSLSLSEWSDVSWVQREWLSKYCIYSRLWDGVSPVCFHAVFRCVPLPSHSVHSPVVHLTHTQAPADILFSYSYSDKHQRADSHHTCVRNNTLNPVSWSEGAGELWVWTMV